MKSSRRVPIFDGHNDVLLRLSRRGGTDVARASGVSCFDWLRHRRHDASVFL